MSGIGYQWVHGKMIYGAQLGVGYSFNKVDAEPRRRDAFGVAGSRSRVDVEQLVGAPAAGQGGVLPASQDQRAHAA